MFSSVARLKSDPKLQPELLFTIANDIRRCLYSSIIASYIAVPKILALAFNWLNELTLTSHDMQYTAEHEEPIIPSKNVQQFIKNVS